MNPMCCAQLKIHLQLEDVNLNFIEFLYEPFDRLSVDVGDEIIAWVKTSEFLKEVSKAALSVVGEEHDDGNERRERQQKQRETENHKCRVDGVKGIVSPDKCSDVGALCKA